jgi:hypothetical protein
MPNVSARWIRMPSLARAGQIEVTKNGVPTIVYFAYPDLTPPRAGAKRSLPETASAAAPSTSAPSPFATKHAVQHDLSDLFAVAE